MAMYDPGALMRVGLVCTVYEKRRVINGRVETDGSMYIYVTILCVPEVVVH